ncbi:Crp/Fnr family transcriptional regulator [Bradyrhizobium sp. B124]|uniref:Crp/Fnr family transcriptional regulator n=1 Tax=Bradyrhizobium sp. B124 TaxID=3140245 RepID=UPI0031845628
MIDRVPAVPEALDYSADTALKQRPGTRPLLHRPPAPRPTKQPFAKNVILKNVILARLSVQHLAAIAECLEPITLKERMVLQEPKRQVEHVYFIETGLVSLRVNAAGRLLETAIIGYRGAVGASFLRSRHLSTHQSVVVFPGSAHRIRVEDLRRVMKAHPEIREHLSKYVQALTFQCVQTGLCGVRHHREQRLASWLCLASDAVDACMLPVTHDYLSLALGMRRAEVTETLARFEEQGLIRKMRGVVQIDQHKSLGETACCCYKLVSGAYASPSVRPLIKEQTS